ncbi:MAG: hypothetical protein HRT83_01795 [Hyphomicrobiaceae bacterium]|nr:hypothetical protein [Hyphomicrobiaceae bacterium]
MPIKRITKIIQVSIFMIFIVVLDYAHAKPVVDALYTKEHTIVQTSGLIQLVHGCHRSPRIGNISGFRHFHVGSSCVRVNANKRNRCKRWRRICRNRCIDFNAPRPRRCRSYCYMNNAPEFCF